MNFLEELAAEWYAYKGFFVRTNVKFGKRVGGGYEGEIDVAAYDPKTKRLVHIETSSDADSCPERKKRFTKKFGDASRHYEEIFDFQLSSIENLAIVGYARRTRNQVGFGSNIKVLSVPEFAQEIIQFLSSLNPTKATVPEGYPLLRAIQFAVTYGKTQDTNFGE